MQLLGTSSQPAQRRRIVWGYVAMASLWIAATDLGLVAAGSTSAVAQTAKGGAFVTVSASVLAVLLRRHDRRLSEEQAAHRDQEHQLAMMVASTKDVIYRIELDPRRFTFVSSSITALLGITPAEVLDDPTIADRLVHPDDRELREATAGDETIRLRWRHRNGRTLWTEQRNRPDELDGVAVAIVGVARDVTEQVLGASVRAACSQLDRIVLDGGSADRGLSCLAGTLRATFEAHRLHIVVDEVAGDAIDIEVLDDGSATGIIPLSATSGLVEVRLTPSRHTPATATVQPLLEVLAARIETSAHHDRRRRELERVEVALNATGIATLLTDVDGRITWVNEAFATLTRCTHPQVRGRTLASFSDGTDPELHTTLLARNHAGLRHERELMLVRADGSTFLANVTVAPVTGADGRLDGSVASILDVTDERRRSEQLHAAQLAVLLRQRDLERERTVLVQTLSHELRTPLTVVLGAAQTLQRDALPDAARERLVRSLERGTDDLLRHLDAVLSATDGLAGEVVATTGRAIVGIALERLASRHDLDRVVITGDASWTGPATEAASLVRPLLHNALKFSPEETRVEVAIGIEAGRSIRPIDPVDPRVGRGVVVIEVVDHGPGIPEALAPLLSTPFTQADGSVTRRHGGLGLGLHAARRSADRLGAKLATRTGPNGTCVRVELPVTASEAAAAIRPAEGGTAPRA